jgi:hypothetical protein
MKICIYQETSDRKHYQLRAVLPATRFDKKPAIHLLHHSDINKKPGHYELIISNTTDADSQQSKEFNVEFDEQKSHAAIAFLVPNKCSATVDFIELVNSITPIAVDCF